MGLWSGRAGPIVGTMYVRRRIAGAQHRENRGQAMRRRQAWIGVFVMIAVLLVISTVPGHADRGGHGYTGHGYKSHGYRGHRHRGHRFHHGYRGPRVGIGIGLGTFWGSDWGGFQSSSDNSSS